MKINAKKIFGGIGAVILSVGGLIAAGKSGFGENLSFGKSDDDGAPAPDNTAPAAEPEKVEAEEVKEEAPNNGGET